MPTQKKIDKVEEVKELIEKCTSAFSTDFSGMEVDDMNMLRRNLRENGVTFKVIKNRLSYLAADSAEQPHFREIIQGPTGMAFGFSDPVAPAKVIDRFIQENQSALQIKGGIIGDRVLTADDVTRLAQLPSRDILLAQLLGQIQSPITNIAYIINGPVSALARVLQRHSESVTSEIQTDSDQEHTPEVTKE